MGAELIKIVKRLEVVSAVYPLSRSPAIVAVFIAMTVGLSVDDALKMIQEKRRAADPDPVVWESIREAEARFC